MFWDIDLTGTEQLVAQRLAWHADDESGKCWPGIALICSKTGLGERAVQKAIKSLAAAGHIEREEARGLGVVYFVHPRTKCGGSRAEVNGMGQAANDSAEPPHDVHPRKECAPAPDAPTPARRAPKEVKKPSNEIDGSASAGRERMITGQRGRRIEIDWIPAKPLPDEVAKVVAGWPPGRLDEEIAEFRDFWISDAGQRASKLDWDRTWWNRLRAIIKHDRRQEEKRGDGKRFSNNRPSGFAPRPGREGSEPAYLADD